MERNLSTKDLQEINKEGTNRRKGNRRVAINSCIDPQMDRRSGKDRRKNKCEK